MPETDIIAQILELARDPEGSSLLLELNASLQLPDLYEAGVDTFGGWDGALVAALVAAAKPAPKPAPITRGAAPAPKAVEIDVEQVLASRQVGPRASDPFLASTTTGYVLKLPPEQIIASVATKPRPLPALEPFGQLEWMRHWPSGHDLVFFTGAGLIYSCDHRRVLQPDDPLTPQRAIDILHFPSSDDLTTAISRPDFLGSGCLLHVTRGGKCKKTRAREYIKVFEQGGLEAFLLAKGDRPAACLHVPELGRVFIAAQQGNGIHFELRDVRAMGRKAMGVKAMSLTAGDAVAGATDVTEHSEVLIISRKGVAKRINVDDFRVQGRGGQGMIAMRPGPDDRLQGVVAVSSDLDLLLVTTLGRYLRLPSGAIPMLERAACGVQVVDLAEGEAVTDVTSVPAGPI